MLYLLVQTQELFTTLIGFSIAEMNHLLKNHEITHKTACLYCFSHTLLLIKIRYCLSKQNKFTVSQNSHQKILPT